MADKIFLSSRGIILLFIAGCSATIPRPAAKEYYTQANEAFEKEDYLAATDNYQGLLDQYPLNPYAEEAQLKMAYAHYLDERYTEAVGAFSDFERAYPTSSHMPFVQYYRGMCYFEQMRTSDRDQAVTQKAHEFFQDVIDRYPESSFARLAEEKSRAAREVMAGHELYVAEFNQKIGNVYAVRARLRTVIEEYPETQATTEALARLEPLLSADGQTELAELAAKALAVRRAAQDASAEQENQAEPPEETQVAALDTADLPAPGVDPLLLLVTELKKQEEEKRQQQRNKIETAAKEETTEKEAQENQKEDESISEQKDVAGFDEEGVETDDEETDFDKQGDATYYFGQASEKE